jgi:uncharacterized membrane protein
MSDTPPGWTRNPSAWPHRLPVVALSLAGFLVAGYLALYQMGVFPTVWEPFFGGGSARVLHSWVSRLLPIPDAALGALAYLAEGVAAVVGGRDRWRTFPWAVVVYGVLAGLLGLTAITLVVCQPVFFHSWCTLCLTSAGISIMLAAWAVDEVWAAVRHLRGEPADRGRSAQTTGG